MAPGSSVGAGIVNQAFEQPDQDAPLVGRQAGKRQRIAGHPPQQLCAKTGAGGRQPEHLHAAVLCGGTTLDEAARLEAIDQARDVGGIARQRLRKAAHRNRLSGLEQMEHVTLNGGEAELRAPGRQVATLDEEEPHQQLPRAARVLFSALHCLDYS